MMSPGSPLALASINLLKGVNQWKLALRGQRVKLLGLKAHVPLKISHLATVCVVGFSAVVASRVEDLGAVNVFNGAFQVATLVGLGPGLVGIYLLGKRGAMW